MNLTPYSGPFLSLPVLLKVFPQGLDAHDPDHLRDLRLAHGEWEGNLAGRRPDPAIHTAWIRFVLAQTLEMSDDLIAEGQAIAEGLKAVVAEHGETLRPDLVIKAPNDGKVRLLVRCYPPSQDLNKPVADRRWKASPATRMTELLHGTDIRLGLVTNGEHWMLVDAPRGDTSGYISWYATLWQEEHITLRAFRSLLCARRFFGVPDNETLEAMLAESAENQQEVTDQLGYQVRRAVEVLVQSLDQADRDHGGDLLADVSEVELYNAALTVMMRLVFLFCAEERDLLLLGDPIFDQHYAVSTLRAQLRETADQHGEEILERRFDAWCRLLATFRAVHGGVQHEAMRLLAYGGRLFDPDRFPFLEGRKPGTCWQDTPASPLPVNNRTVLHLLESLQILEVKVPGGGPAEARRLSFQALDIEQIGHVYEGLLDHTAKRATEPTLSLKGAKYEEPEIELSVLEQLRDKGEDELLKFLKDQTKRTVSPLKKALHAEPDLELSQRLRVACGNDEKLYARVEPFAGLIREDTFGNLVVIPAGSVFVTAGVDRRTTGTHYTPRSLTEPIVQYTLEPLVYVGPAEGKPKEEWKLKPAAELLKLKLCDMAMGSGAFLVQACRYMSERLVESWEEIEAAADGRVVATPEGDLSTGAPDELPIPRDAEERLAIARRIVADRCLYGVDINPMAVEMAKLSLWLITLDKHRPFTFLDHAFKCGDSLVGISNLKQLETFSLDCQADVIPTLLDPIGNKIAVARTLREQLEALPSNTLDDISVKQRKNGEADEHIRRLAYVAEMLVCAEFKATSHAEREAKRHDALYESLLRFADAPLPELTTALGGERRAASITGTFHWPLQFPEVFEQGGFDAFVCNPPFRGGKLISGIYGKEYREYLVSHLAKEVRGHADLCAYFFLRASQLMRGDGICGLLATNTISQGETREVGLDQICRSGRQIVRTIAGYTWPGTANLEVSVVWLRGEEWDAPCCLDGQRVRRITPYLAEEGAIAGSPKKLVRNRGHAFQGTVVLGLGFTLTPQEAEEILNDDDRYRSILFPYLTGQDLNSRPDQSASRWVINFGDLPLDRESAPPGHDGPVAADYPVCLEIVRERVKPERDKLGLKKDSSAKGYAKLWWQFARRSVDLYEAARSRQEVLVASRVSKYVAHSILPVGLVYDVGTNVILHNSLSWLAVLESGLYEAWVRKYASTLETRIRYILDDCFGTFPFPAPQDDLGEIGLSYHGLRRNVAQRESQGLTKLLNRVHTSHDSCPQITKLRELQANLDMSVAAAYGWTDLDLEHAFHKTKQGNRFTISDSARREVLARLLKLNHERYAEEVAQGLHDKRRTKKGSKRKHRSKKTNAAEANTGKLF